MRSFSFYIMMSLILPACHDDAAKINATVENQPTERDSLAINFLALGDSYTIGHSVTLRERWPVILASELREKKVKINDPRIIATTGWTTSDLLRSLEGFKPQKSFDIVSLMIGVNNQYQGRSKDTYRIEFRQLLTKSVEYAGGKVSRVFVLSIPDWGVSTIAAEGDRERIAREIDEFNAIAKYECEKANILFVNITDISRSALNDPSVLASDGLHFSGKMHQLWVNAMIPLISSKVKIPD